MPSRQQKSAKKGSEMYLMFRSNLISVTLRWGRSSGHENVRQWLLNRCKKLMRPSKQRNGAFLEKCSNWNLNYQTWLKALCLGVSEPTKQLAAQGTAYALTTDKVNRYLSKEMKKDN